MQNRRKKTNFIDGEEKFIGRRKKALGWRHSCLVVEAVVSVATLKDGVSEELVGGEALGVCDEEESACNRRKGQGGKR